MAYAWSDVLRRELPLRSTARAVLRETARLLLRPLGIVNWRRGADVAKRRPVVLRVAERLGRDEGRVRFVDHLWPPPPPRCRPDVPRLLRAPLGAAHIGHATLLLRVGGRTILTDPVFSPRVGVGVLFATIGPRRHLRPALRLDELPPIDLILSSHAHFDHLDRPSLWRLARRFADVPVIAAAGTVDLFLDLGFRQVAELDWEQETNIAGLRVTAVPVRHWGPRVFYDNWRGYNAYLVEGSSHRVLFAGDTALTDTFDGLGPLDLMAVGISAYDPYIAAHATPEQAWAMSRAAGAARVLPMHHSTFRLSHEPMDEPLRRFRAAAGDEQHRIVAARVGEMWVGE